MILLALTAAAAAAAAAAAPQPGMLHTFKDWIVGCDNLRNCQAVALIPDGADLDGDAMPMPVITREGTPKAPATLVTDLPDKTVPGDRIDLLVDGAVIMSTTVKTTDGAKMVLTRAVLTALLNGKSIATRKGGGATTATASLAGLAAALLYIDDQQKRVGTMGALKATGPKPDSSVPAPPPAPVIMTPAPSARPPRTISVAQATRLIGDDNARCEYGEAVKPEAHRLDATHSLVLIEHPCGNGAYNVFSSVYVLDETGPPRAAAFDLTPGMNGDAADLTNGGWDPKTRLLGSYEKGRGLGDCGSAESYAWDGRRFRLIEATTMGECRGSHDWITVWTARAETLPRGN